MDDATPFRRMLVAIDDSPAAQAAVGLVAEWVDGPGADVRFVQVTEERRQRGNDVAQVERPGGRAAGTSPRGERADVGRPQPSTGPRHRRGGGGLRRRRHRPRLRPTAPGRSPACAQPARADHARHRAAGPGGAQSARRRQSGTTSGPDLRRRRGAGGHRARAMPVFDTVVVGAADSEGADAGLPPRPRADAGHRRHAAHRRCHRQQERIPVGAVAARRVPLHGGRGPARPIGSCPSSSRRPPARRSTSTTHPVLDDPAGAITRVAADEQADLVVVGSGSDHGARPSPTCRRPSWTTWAVPSWSCRERTRTAR